MATKQLSRVDPKRQRVATDASKALIRTRRRARLTFKQIGEALDIHPRTIARWELGETHPSKTQWTKVIGYLARFVPQEAVELATVAGVPSPIPEVVPVDMRVIEDALLRAADVLDVSPRRVRAALREIVKATAKAHGTLADLGQAAEEKTATSSDELS